MVVVIVNRATIIVNKIATAIAAIVGDEATFAVAVIVDEAAIIIDGAAKVWTNRAVDKSDVLVPSCKVGLNLNLSLKFNCEGIFNHGPRQKTVI